MTEFYLSLHKKINLLTFKGEISPEMQFQGQPAEQYFGRWIAFKASGASLHRPKHARMMLGPAMQAPPENPAPR